MGVFLVNLVQANIGVSSIECDGVIVSRCFWTKDHVVGILGVEVAPDDALDGTALVLRVGAGSAQVARPLRVLL